MEKGSPSFELNVVLLKFLKNCIANIMVSFKQCGLFFFLSSLLFPATSVSNSAAVDFSDPYVRVVLFRGDSNVVSLNFLEANPSGLIDTVNTRTIKKVLLVYQCLNKH